MTYGITGNILSKSDVGSYTYGQVNGQCASGFAGPHAVTSISGTKNTTYCYDANGNMTTGDGRIITYTAFDKPTRITKGGNTVEFFYGPDRKRFKRVDNTVENGTVTTIYAAGKAYERIENAQSVTAKHYIGDFAVLTQTINTGTVAVNYLHRDHLGSVETITNEAGIVTQRMSFDAWGKRREVNWQPMGEEAIATFNTDTTTRGFTGHEQIDAVGLIHMNGRVYDAELGRFLSADPHIQALDNLQNFNRYSYVLNNPLSYTDPTGFFFSKLFKAIGKAFGKIFKAIGRAFKKLLRSPIFRAIIQIVACANPVTGIQCALAAGALTAAAGGSLSDVFKAVAFSFVSHHVWSGVKAFARVNNLSRIGQALLHGVVNGALTAARGGNFVAGFAAGLIGKSTAILARGLDIASHTFVVAVAGCASSVVAGGKCANGALTAAFANLFNEWKTTVQKAKSVAIFVGGAADGSTKGVVYQVHKHYQGTKVYVTHNELEKLIDYIQKYNTDGYEITLVGHSWGGTTAMQAVANGNYVNKIITVDPVGSKDVLAMTSNDDHQEAYEGRPDYALVKKYSGTWNNYYTNNLSGRDNFVGLVGGRYGNELGGYPDSNVKDNRYGHANICYKYCVP